MQPPCRVTWNCYETKDKSQTTNHVVHHIYPGVQRYMGVTECHLRVPYSFAVRVGWKTKTKTVRAVSFFFFSF